jgi:hypothetical protein
VYRSAAQFAPFGIGASRPIRPSHLHVHPACPSALADPVAERPRGL